MRHFATALAQARHYATAKGKHREADTIFALASGQGRAGIAVVRVSGPEAQNVYHRLCPRSRTLPPSHRLVRRDLYHPSTGELLDQAALIFFAEGRSYTSEASLELHLHGGSATVRDVLSALGTVCRPAGAGEFTRRAFTSGRMDLASSEALHALISADTSVQRRLALSGARGGQTARYDAMRATLLEAMAMIEALIDFADEEVDDGAWEAACDAASRMHTLVSDHLAIRHAEVLARGIRLALYGPPNAGKSSLLNALADREAAIVSSIPGTTRDVIEVHLEVAGYKVVAYDTAGLRTEPRDEIERIGISRAREAVQQADLALCVYPCTKALGAAPLLRPQGYTASQRDLVFLNKADLVPGPVAPSRPNARIWTGSVQTGQGLTELVEGLKDEITAQYSHVLDEEAPLITQERHRFHLVECRDALARFQEMAKAHDLVLAAEELRIAATALGKVTGSTVNADEILGQIFSKFCIGK